MVLYVLSFFLVFFGLFQTITIYGGDGGDIVSAAISGGIAHPPGYPLFSFLGYLLSMIPYSTPAWRVTLLSSIPTAISTTLIFVIVRSMYKSSMAGIVSASIYATLYITWLYAVVPEVFALNSMFVLIIIYLNYLLHTTKDIKYILYIAFMYGLGLSHHHTILFTFPATLYSIYYVFNNTKRYSLLAPTLIKSILVGLCGLLPNVWAVISAHTVPAVMWNDPVTFKNFIELITRAQYGTFQSAINIAGDIRSRFLQFPIIFEFYRTDFTIIGLALAGVGAYYLHKVKTSFFNFLMIGFIFTGPAYFFYATYTISNEFHIGTMERFFQLSYIFLTLFVAGGVYYVADWATTTIKSKLTYSEMSQSVMRNILIGGFAIITIINFAVNYPKISVLKNDLTAEKFGEDVLETTEKNSIIFLQSDTFVFNTEYVYLTNPQYKDRTPIHFTKLIMGELTKQLKKYHPHIKVPPKHKEYTEFVSDFIELHYNTYPIYSTQPITTTIKQSYWVPQGLLYRFYKKEDLPSSEELIRDTETIINRYQDPLAGSLGTYRNLMLWNTADFYRDAYSRTATMYSELKKYDRAEYYYKKSLRINSQNKNVLYLLAEVYSRTKRCKEAEDTIKDARSIVHFIKDDLVHAKAQVILYDECYHDASKTSQWKKEVQKYEKELEQKLKL